MCLCVQDYSQASTPPSGCNSNTQQLESPRKWTPRSSPSRTVGQIGQTMWVCGIEKQSVMSAFSFPGSCQGRNPQSSKPGIKETDSFRLPVPKCKYKNSLYLCHRVKGLNMYCICLFLPSRLHLMRRKDPFLFLCPGLQTAFTPLRTAFSFQWTKTQAKENRANYTNTSLHSH